MVGLAPSVAQNASSQTSFAGFMTGEACVSACLPQLLTIGGLKAPTIPAPPTPRVTASSRNTSTRAYQWPISQK